VVDVETAACRRARVCVLRSWHDGCGYGFTLLARRGDDVHRVGAVDPGSPAAAAGLRPADRLVEVNGVQVRCAERILPPTDQSLNVSRQSDWLPSAAELFRSPLPTPGTLFLSTSSQLLRCSHLNVI